MDARRGNAAERWGCGAVPARAPHLAARRRPIFLRMKLLPMNALEATASARPLVLSETASSTAMAAVLCGGWMPPNAVPEPNPCLLCRPASNRTESKPGNLNGGGGSGDKD